MLSAEHRGIYMDCLCLIYERDAVLPADDKWMSHALHVSNRAWRSARMALLRAGKLTFLQDGWSNSRADEERMIRRSTADQNAIIARSREDQKREKSKNGNENNETTPQSVPRNEHHAGAYQSLESRESEKDTTPTVEHLAAREGEVDVGHGVLVNCETIRHREFNISLKAIDLQLCGTVPRERIKSVAQGFAVGWAADIEAGKRPSQVLPTNAASFIRASIQASNNKAASFKPKAAKSYLERY